MINEEAENAALLLASMKVTESLLECRDPTEPRTLSKVDQVGLTIIPGARFMSTTNSLPPFSFATRGLNFDRCEVTARKNARKDCDVADNNRQQSENIVLCDQETNISTLVWIKVGDRDLTTLETNGVDSEWVKAPSQDRIVVLQ